MAFLTGTARQGRIGVGWRTLQAARTEPAVEPTLEVAFVDAAIDRLAAMSGAGVGAAHGTCSRTCSAGRPRRAGARRIFTGEMRQGALDGVMVEAIVKGSGVSIADVRRAHMMAGDLGQAARAALTEGAAAVAAIALIPGRAVQPMLASPADDVAAAVAATGPASVEWKLDGAHPSASTRWNTSALHPQPERGHGAARRRRRPRGRPPRRRPRPGW